MSGDRQEKKKLHDATPSRFSELAVNNERQCQGTGNREVDKDVGNKSLHISAAPPSHAADSTGLLYSSIPEPHSKLRPGSVVQAFPPPACMEGSIYRDDTLLTDA